MTLRNTRGVDILVTREDLTRSAGIPVKTKRGSTPEWILTKKAESLSEDSVLYAFVRLMDGGHPLYHIVPSSFVAEYATRTHREWLSSPGQGGRVGRDSSVRKFVDRDERFLDRWNLLDS